MNPLLRVAISLLALGLVLAACATNPVTGGKDLALVSESQEIELGRKSDAEVRAQYGVYDDPALQRYVNDIGQRLAAASHRPGLKFHFTVLDSAEVNAFALPGGYVYITRGIMAYLQSEAELAAVLGHEIGHVTARHGVRQYSAAVAANVGFAITSIFVPALQNEAGQSLFNVLGGALLSGYGREHELESDRLGAQYLARTNYDPNAMIDVISVLKNQELFERERAKAEGREARTYHGVFASHPSNDQRLQEVVAEAHKLKAPGLTRVERETYLKRTDKLVFGDGERDGTVRGNRFYHKPLDFTLAFPEGWTVENSAQALQATPRARDAVMQVVIDEIRDSANPHQFFVQRLKISNARAGESFAVNGLPAYSAIARLKTPFGVRDARITVVFYKGQAFVFLAAAKAESASPYDAAFLQTARSFRPLTAEERRLAEPLRIYVTSAKRGETFAALAKASPLTKDAEAALRLINNHYPTGEPQPGGPLKIVK